MRAAWGLRVRRVSGCQLLEGVRVCGGCVCSARVMETRGDAGTRGAVVTPEPSPWGIEGPNKAGTASVSGLSKDFF